MPSSERPELALIRLSSALQGLESAAQRRLTREALGDDAAEEFAMLQEDRSRLAGELDESLARMRALEDANIETGRRIERASVTLRAMLVGAAGAES